MNFLLNRGGAGKSLSRAQTAAEMSKLMIRHIELLRTYDALIESIGNDASIENLKALQQDNRADISKLSEIILSSGGVPPREGMLLAGDGADALIKSVNNAERELRSDIEEQLEQKHHLRTLAIMETLLANTQLRIGLGSCGLGRPGAVLLAV